MPNWYKSLKDVGKGALIAPLGLSLLAPLVQPQKPATEPTTQSVPEVPMVEPATEPTSQPTGTIEKGQSSPVYIDVNKIIHMESAGKPNAVSGKGAGGLMQIMPATWNDIVRKMGKNWTAEDRFDPQKNVEAGTFYMNVEIPKLLKHFNLPDSVEMRLAAYNWGAGALSKVYRTYGDKWLEHAPAETQKYVKKYNG